MTERKRISEKTYIYYFSVEKEKLAYWLMWNKYAKMDSVAECTCNFVVGNGKERAYELMVTFK